MPGSYKHKCDPLQVNGQAVEPHNLCLDALDSENEAVLPQGHGYSSADTQLEQDGGRVH